MIVVFLETFLIGTVTLFRPLRLFVEAVRPRFMHVFWLPRADHSVHVELLFAAVRVVVLGDCHFDGAHTVADQVDNRIVRDLGHGYSVDGNEEVPGPEPRVVRGRIGDDAGENAGLLA